MTTDAIACGDVLYLWHPTGAPMLSGYGLATVPNCKDGLVGLLMIDRPIPAPAHWLQRVQETFGDYTLYVMTMTHERGMACHLRIEASSLPFVRRLDHPLAREIQPVLARLLADDPKPHFVVGWDPNLRLWVSRFDLAGNDDRGAASAWPLFRPGNIVATPGVLDALEQNGQSPLAFLERHVMGDWGELPPEDVAENDRALMYGSRLFSSYRMADGTKLWIITEWDRSVTTLLLPSGAP